MSRPFNRSTPLGELMWQRGYTVKGLEQATGISYRTISDYLAGRKPIISQHIVEFTHEFNVPREVLLGHEPIRPDTNRAVTGKIDAGSFLDAWKQATG